MYSENWGFEITIRALDVEITTNILTLPNWYDLIYQPKTGRFYVNS